MLFRVPHTSFLRVGSRSFCSGALQRDDLKSCHSQGRLCPRRAFRAPDAFARNLLFGFAGFCSAGLQAGTRGASYPCTPAACREAAIESTSLPCVLRFSSNRCASLACSSGSTAAMFNSPVCPAVSRVHGTAALAPRAFKVRAGSRGRRKIAPVLLGVPG